MAHLHLCRALKRGELARGSEEPEGGGKSTRRSASKYDDDLVLSRRDFVRLQVLLPDNFIPDLRG